MKYEFDEKNMSSTKFFYGEPVATKVADDQCLKDMEIALEHIFDEIDEIALVGATEYCQPCKYEIPIKDKTLEVLEREFALKYPGPYKSFKDEQDRQLIEFIKTYTQNHEVK